MKKLINIIKWWLVLPFFSILFLIGCQSREKAVSKSESESEKKVESNYKIEDKTFEIVFDKSFFSQHFFYKNISDESSKNEKKTTEKGKEYYENGNLKKEWERDLSELSEITKKTITELEETVKKESEKISKIEKERTELVKTVEKEKQRNSTYEMQLKKKDKAGWYLFGYGIIIGLLIPLAFNWFKAWLMRFNPWLRFIEKFRRNENN